ncbi:AMP-binding protein [Actinotalea sp. M2MS4P-6]|uniref:AMP-binding protein n=1 Tax=Actinotalea sp. M2MS4P-6 TaxID=2983762 RepID=UPI0021E51026|nr:AMP-binding protein [Actinotalea sp. M2MS4P-6]MCV2394461.1 AMP-binding protein [Actinotalea sp. M2MS4P-6]
MADIATGQTTTHLWDTACRRFGDRPFLVHLGPAGRRSEFSYAQFAALVHQAAHAFRAVGVGPGDTVILQLGNGSEVLSALFGLAEIGAIAVPTGLGATPAELLRAYRACGARWAVVDATRVGDHLALREEGLTELRVLAGGDVSHESAHDSRTAEPGVQSYAELCRRQPAAPVTDAQISDETVLELLYTSGTTAAPKGVMVTHANVVFSGHYGVWQTSLRSDDRLLTTMPSCHSNFQLAALTPVLVAGAALIVVDRYSASHFWQQVRAERATVVQLIAMMARTLMLQPPSPDDGVHEVREALYFMPLSDAEKAEFERRFRIRLLNSYGSTESIGWAVTDPPQGERRWPSVGRAGLGYEVGIFDEAGRELPAGRVGEFRIKGVPGRSLMLGYHDDPAATAAALGADGWLRTHDQGYRDEDGWFYFVDRSINVIKRAGENVSATEVECVLTSHPLVAEAAVVGVPDPVRDRAVKAFVRLDPGAALSPTDLTQHCRERLAPYKVPELVEIVDDFPRTESMKIEKRLLH